MSPTKHIYFDLTGSRWREAGQSIAVILLVVQRATWSLLGNNHSTVGEEEAYGFIRA